MKTLVVIESPYRGLTSDITADNIRFAQKALAHSLSLGEAPIALHLLYTQLGILRDHDPVERQLGIDAGLAWLRAADRHVFYTDRGWSTGMLAALAASPKFHSHIYIRGLQFPPKPPAKVPAGLTIIEDWCR